MPTAVLLQSFLCVRVAGAHGCIAVLIQICFAERKLYEESKEQHSAQRQHPRVQVEYLDTVPSPADGRADQVALRPALC
eukprot:442221-Hanusia_phi.AAC.4